MNHHCTCSCFDTLERNFVWRVYKFVKKKKITVLLLAY